MTKLHTMYFFYISYNIQKAYIFFKFIWRHKKVSKHVANSLEVLVEVVDLALGADMVFGNYRILEKR